ncbi:DUF3892 domain-containing protein [Neobacillus jeddahensis]|uniref:DUF3892 domain-containing protein n=1 Tax=Neobacillus jeddahensis TaxID=1461580 RepID=UPI00058B0348|nr:DUF3892 domain-containing protein [Neobacillus jeddahensis]
METITAVHRNHFGEIISFVTSEGRIISYRKALMDAENGLIQGVQPVNGGEGTTLLAPDTHSSFDDYPNLF